MLDSMAAGSVTAPKPPMGNVGLVAQSIKAPTTASTETLTRRRASRRRRVKDTLTTAQPVLRKLGASIVTLSRAYVLGHAPPAMCDKALIFAVAWSFIPRM
jgi:hypothetical protein